MAFLVGFGAALLFSGEGTAVGSAGGLVTDGFCNAALAKAGGAVLVPFGCSVSPLPVFFSF